MRFYVLALFALLTINACDGKGDAQFKVYKSDGAKQCEGPGVSVNEMRTELIEAGIPVFCGQKAYDGMMHASCCGCNSDTINVYSIQKEDLQKAEKQGFKSVSELAQYKDKECEI